MRLRVFALIAAIILPFQFLACGSGSSKPSPNPTPAPATWTWVSGASVANQQGTYGTLGVAAASNVPGARSSAASWTDVSGDFWLFGGAGYDSTGALGALNDMWKYSAGRWTWMGGSNLVNQAGIYGTEGMPAPSNTPGAREGASYWQDASANFWLFGGGSEEGVSEFSDLWKYSGGEWTWIAGPNICCQPGTYGTQGVAAPGNTPGWRFGALGWADAGGNSWIYGGSGVGSFQSSPGLLNDLWKYSGREWTWVSGESVVVFLSAGVYGVEGVPAPGNVPGSRGGSGNWTDASGNLWLFGGGGSDSTGVGIHELNDLWRYSGGEWTWMNGSKVGDQPGTYGNLGVAATSNVPGGRGVGVSWKDSSGNMWLFGGAGYDSTSTINYHNDSLNDLWKYSNGEWTWMAGSNRCCQPGVYGTIGESSPSNEPGARGGSVGWTDANGNLWLFGGQVLTSNGTVQNFFNDLWEYKP